jgi:EAL domain-containing protein (putative c-di-GMP-specific phosphodiesterase class I)
MSRIATVTRIPPSLSRGLNIVGANNARVLASVKRAAEARGLPVIGVASRPLGPIDIETMLTLRLLVAPPIPREEIAQALAEHELTLVYQPKLAIDSAVVRIQGVEALVRWQHPRRGLLHPRHFLNAVEDCGLMSQLTDFVMTEAVRQDGQWRVRGLQFEIIVNLSTKLVKDREFSERLAVLLQEHDFPPQLLVLDVTEALSLDDRSLLLDVFTRLRLLGVGLSLDNFGTGQSSLTELYGMPFSEIVDNSLIADVPREREARVIVKAIVNLAHNLGLVVCAEGVETSRCSTSCAARASTQRRVDFSASRFRHERSKRWCGYGRARAPRPPAAGGRQNLGTSTALRPPSERLFHALRMARPR